MRRLAPEVGLALVAEAWLAVPAAVREALLGDGEDKEEEEVRVDEVEDEEGEIEEADELLLQQMSSVLGDDRARKATHLLPELSPPAPTFVCAAVAEAP